MRFSMKPYIRDSIPQKFQVPIKYKYSQIMGYLEPEFQLKELLVKANTSVTDIGANRGGDSYKLWKLGQKVEIFEPNPECGKALSVWSVNRKRTSFYQIALSNDAGSGTLHIPIDESGVEHDASASIEELGLNNENYCFSPIYVISGAGMAQTRLARQALISKIGYGYEIEIVNEVL